MFRDVALTWQSVDLRSDPYEAEYRFDPGELVASAGLLLEAIGRPAWMADAACRDHPELTWFPGQGVDVRAAVQICGECPVRKECLDYAAGYGELLAGVWGGLSPGERRRQRRRTAA